jgi:hypothetical protein
MSEDPFRPILAKTVNVSGSTTSANVSLGLVGGCQVRVHNSAGAAAFVTFGNSAVTASASTDMPVPAGGVELFTVPNSAGDNLYAAAVLASGTGSVYFTPGVGE